MGRIALFGAAGAVGQSVASALRADGQPYRVVGRSRSALDAAFAADPLAERVVWDPDDAASVRDAARGIDTIIYLVGVPYDQFRLHPVVMRQTLDGAIAEGVARMVLIGTVYPYGKPRGTPLREDHPRLPHTLKGQMRKAQEDLLFAADAAGALRGTVLRVPDFYGPLATKSLLADLFRAALAGRRAKLLGPIDVPHEFVFVPDIGPVALALARSSDAYGRAWHLGGAGTISQRAFAARVFAAVELKPRLLVADNWLVRLLGLVDPLMRELPEMHYLLTTPVVMDDGALHRLLGGVSKTSYDDGIRRTLDALRASAAP
jgi:nucleoside-diphosphate-sugar epimerase